MKLRRDDANQIVPSLTKECKALGQQVLLGQLDRHTIHLGVHMIANYKHYLNRTTLMNPDKEILVIRTESLWADMKHLDLWLGGNGTFGNLEGLKISHGSETYAKRDELSETGTKLLCCFLLDEMILYRHLLESAANLDEGTKSDAIISAAKQCYFPTWDVMVSKCQAP